MPTFTKSKCSKRNWKRFERGGADLSTGPGQEGALEKMEEKTPPKEPLDFWADLDLLPESRSARAIRLFPNTLPGGIGLPSTRALLTDS
jgi:hypothetical protein